MAKRKNKATRVSPKATGRPVQVDFQRNDLANLLPSYYMIRDAIEGEPAIKGLTGTATNGVPGNANGGLPMSITNIVLTRAVRYLPQPNAEDRSAANVERYRAYVTRAVFYEVTGRTLEGMVGQIFMRDPVIELPTELDILLDDADGEGVSLDQTANRACRACLAYGRAGILVDYPDVIAPATKKDIADGDIRPTITIYEPWNIINWRVESEGGKRSLVFVVLREAREEEGEDGFQLTSFEQFRVLKIDPDSGNHVVEVYRKDGGGTWGDPEIHNPKDAKGQPLTEIPFSFIGSENNNTIPDRPPLYGLAALNIAHYRNSADYEEACFIVGQPTPVLAGLTEDWVKNILGGAVPLGSRAAISLPVGATAQLLQVAPNIMPSEAMKHKEDQMVALGAKLVQTQRQTKQTATEKIIESSSESSTLASVAKNVSHAFVWALGIAADFVGTAKAAIKYELNKDFDLTSMTADDQNAVIKQWQSGAIDFTEMRTVLRRAGTAKLDDAEARTLIQKDIADGLIPDPAMVNAPAGANDPKGASPAGGPQPKGARRQGSPGTTA